ncbi:MAG: hypothetical protein KDK24_10350 [Pseudooceanicola sp.]|nr:hypothetical protein [Pseudooceanicola sp.]
MRQMILSVLFVPSFWMILGGVSMADIRVIVIDEHRLPYDLGPSKYSNSPSNYDNSPSNYENSESNYGNSPSNYANSSSNYKNSINGDRRVVSEDNTFLGYYVFGPDGIINFYSAGGNRIGYIPGGGHTQSIFSENGWCGTMGERRRQPILGLTQSCYYRFLLDN